MQLPPPKRKLMLAAQVAQDMVTSMLAKGYTLATDAMAKAKAYDEKHQITAKMMAKAKEVDEKYGISEKAKAGYTAADAKLKEVDEKYKITEKVTAGANAAQDKINAGAEAAMKNPTVAKGMDYLNAGFNKLTTKASEVKDETM